MKIKARWIAKNIQRGWSGVVTFVLVVATSQILAQPPAAVPSGDTSNPTEPAPQSASELQSLVAPIALYPDALVAQILTASTFPGPGGHCRLLAAAKQEPDGKRFDAGG